MDLTDLTPEQRRRAAECKTPEEMLACAQEEGVELSDEDLEKVVGGSIWEKQLAPCPNCDSSNVLGARFYRKCRDCGYEWNEGL